jgi:hypothetical protein
MRILNIQKPDCGKSWDLLWFNNRVICKLGSIPIFIRYFQVSKSLVAIRFTLCSGVFPTVEHANCLWTFYLANDSFPIKPVVGI